MKREPRFNTLTENDVAALIERYGVGKANWTLNQLDELDKTWWEHRDRLEKWAKENTFYQQHPSLCPIISITF